MTMLSVGDKVLFTVGAVERFGAKIDRRKRFTVVEVRPLFGLPYPDVVLNTGVVIYGEWLEPVDSPTAG